MGFTLSTTVKSINDTTPWHKSNSFNLLRLFAALLVFTNHLAPFVGDYNIFARWTVFQSNGGLGVTIFFVISGYLVTQSMFRSTNRVSFIRKRALRIYPGLLVFLMVAIATVFFLGNSSFVDFFTSRSLIGFLLNAAVFPLNPCVSLNFPSYLYGCDVAGTLWTIPNEITAYLFLALLLPMSRRLILGLLVILFLAITLLIVLLNGVIYSLGDFRLTGWGFVFAYFSPFRSLPFFASFLAGALLSFVSPILLKNNWVLATSLLAYWASFGTRYEVYILAQTIPLTIIVLSMGLRQNRISAFISQLGDFSYGLYLYQFLWIAIVATLFGQVMSPAISVALSFALTLASSIFSWKFVEEPALKFKSSKLTTQPQESDGGANKR